jgi:hypothetical protein
MHDEPPRQVQSCCAGAQACIRVVTPPHYSWRSKHPLQRISRSAAVLGHGHVLARMSCTACHVICCRRTARLRQVHAPAAPAPDGCSVERKGMLLPTKHACPPHAPVLPPIEVAGATPSHTTPLQQHHSDGHHRIPSTCCWEGRVRGVPAGGAARAREQVWPASMAAIPGRLLSPCWTLCMSAPLQRLARQK